MFCYCKPLYAIRKLQSSILNFIMLWSPYYSKPQPLLFLVRGSCRLKLFINHEKLRFSFSVFFVVTTKISRNILKNYTVFRESYLNLWFCRAFKIILILRWIGNYAAGKTHNFWNIPEFIADTNHENNV